MGKKTSVIRIKNNLKIAFIDLNSHSYCIGTLNQHIRNATLGGRGLNAYLAVSLYLQSGKSEFPKTFDDPKNKIYISPGILAGTNYPSSGRTTISVLKSPITKTFSDGNFGGHFGPALKLCGIDCLVIEGKSPIPVCIFIDKNEKIWFLDAMKLKINRVGIHASDAIIKAKYGNVKCLLIGPAGENMCFSSIPLCESRAAGGGGTGAVFGSKNLKGIIVKYNENNTILPREKVFDTLFNNACTSAEQKIKQHPVYNTFRKYGTTSLVEIHSGMNYLPTKNWTETNDKNWKKLSGKAVDRFYKFHYRKGYVEWKKEEGKIGCKNCPIVCSNPSKIEYETLNCLGSKIGISSVKDVESLNTSYFNDLGLDVIQTTSIISTLMELYEKGISNYKIEWGNYQQITSFLTSFVWENDDYNTDVGFYFKRGFKEGLFGSVSDGRISLNIPEKSVEVKINKIYNDYYIHVKGNALSGVVPNIRENKGVALAVSTSSRGADHLRSLPTLATYANWYFKSNNKLSKLKKSIKLVLRAFRIAKGDIKILTGNLYQSYINLFEVPEEIVKVWKEKNFLIDSNKIDGWECMIDFTQNMYALSDSISLCRFVTPWRFGLGPKRLAKDLSALTGNSFTWEDLINVGKRTYAIERYLISLNKSKVLDTLPERFIKSEKDKKVFEKMISNYYKYCGYDNNGVPTEQILRNYFQQLNLTKRRDM